MERGGTGLDKDGLRGKKTYISLPYEPTCAIGERQLNRALEMSERTFFRVLGRSNAFSHMEQEWILLRCRPGGLD